MELHPLDTQAVRILFCGRPALTTGVVNVRLLLGGDGGKYCLAEKRKAKLRHSRRDGTRREAEDGNGFNVRANAKEKRESVYRVCSSDGLPDGCYHVQADRHYWVMRTKRESGALLATTADETPPHPSAPMSAMQATPAPPSMPLAAAVSTAVPSRRMEDDELPRHMQDCGSSAAAGAMSVTAESPSALTSADDVVCADVASKQQKIMLTKTKYVRCANTVEGGVGSPPLIPTTFSAAASRTQVSPQQEQPQEGVPGDAVDVISDAEGALGEPYSGTPPSVRPSAPVVVDILGMCEETPCSQRQREQLLRKRKKASCVQADNIAEEGGGSEAEAAGICAGTKTKRGSNDADGEVSSSTSLAEHRSELGAGSSQSVKKSQPRRKRHRSSGLAAEEPPAPLPLPTLETAMAAQSKTELRPGEFETLAPESAANLKDSAPPPLSIVTDSNSESAPTSAPRARQSRKSSAANSVVSLAATLDAADTTTLSKMLAPPLSPLPLCPVPSGHIENMPRDADTHTASLAPPPLQKHQQVANSPAMRSPASVPQDATPNVLYSNRSSSGGSYAEARRSTAGSTAAPAAHDKMRQQQQRRQLDARSAAESPSTRPQADTNRSASNSSLLGPLPSPLLQRQSEWSGIGGGAAGLTRFHEGAMNGGSGSGAFYPSDSPALGFTQVHNTLTEEFSLDMSESESESAASEYLYDVVE